MNIAIVGATGYTGHYVLQEALNRGHIVTAIVHHTELLPVHAHLHPASIDILNTEKLTQIFLGQDAVISCYNNKILKASKSLIEATKNAGIKRLIEVGDAGCLETKAGVQFVDTIDFPKEWKDEAERTRMALHLLEQEDELDWTYISPSAIMTPGVRTGHYREGQNQLIHDENGKSRISCQDFAAAMIDELERPRHIQESYTVGY